MTEDQCEDILNCYTLEIWWPTDDEWQVRGDTLLFYAEKGVGPYNRERGYRRFLSTTISPAGSNAFAYFYTAVLDLNTRVLTLTSYQLKVL